MRVSCYMHYFFYPFCPPCPPDKEMQAADASLLTKVLRTKLVENVHDVEVQRQDPNSPLYSVKSFEELPLYVLWCVCQQYFTKNCIFLQSICTRAYTIPPSLPLPFSQSPCTSQGSVCHGVQSSLNDPRTCSSLAFG